jgi:hypothetical protein
MVRRACGRAKLPLLLAALAGSAVPLPSAAAPPPPGWEEAYRARACGVAPTPTASRVSGRKLDRREVGIVRLGPAVAFDGGVELRYDPALGRAVGIANVWKQGLVLATDAGGWLRVGPPPISGGFGDARALDVPGSIISVPIVGAKQPRVQSSSIGGSILLADADGSVSRYDVGECGFSARPQPVGSLSDGTSVTTIGSVDPSLVGFDQPGRYVLVGATGRGGYGEAAMGIPSDPVAISPGAPLSAFPAAERTTALAGWNVEAGCDAIRFLRNGTVTQAQSFCSPGFAERTTRILGDVGLPAVRLTHGRPGTTLFELKAPVSAAAEAWAHDERTVLLVLAAAEPGRLRILAFSAKAARYEDPNQHSRRRVEGSPQ